MEISEEGKHPLILADGRDDASPEALGVLSVMPRDANLSARTITQLRGTVY